MLADGGEKESRPEHRDSFQRLWLGGETTTSDGRKGQCGSAAEAHFDLLHLRKDPFHYKSGTLGVIGP